MPLTLVIGSSGKAQCVTVEAARVVIGRASSADVQLPDPSISLRHATLRRRGRHYALLDEDSENGSWLDAERLLPATPYRIKEGARVRLGRVWLELRVDPSAPPTPPEQLAALPRNLVAEALRLDGASAAEAQQEAAEVLAQLRRVPTELLEAEDELTEAAPALLGPPSESKAMPPELAEEPDPPQEALDASSSARISAASTLPKANAWASGDVALIAVALAVLAASALALQALVS